MLKVPETLGESCLEEMNSYNTRQIRNLSVVMSVIALAYIGQNVFFPRSDLTIPSVRGYIFLFSALLFLSLLFLSLSTFVVGHSSESGKRTFIYAFLCSVEILLMLLNFLDLQVGNELTAYIVVLMYLSAVLWITPRTYVILSGFGFFLLVLSFLIINESRSIEFFQVLQGVVFYTLCLVLYLGLHSVRNENFLNRITLEEQYKMLETESTTDPLTGLYNRRYLKEELLKELARSERTGRPFCTVLIDVDHFKDVNDSHGHITGDEVLRELSSLLRNSVRLSDKVFRFGGEEFVLILPETRGEEALVLGERIREKVSAFSFSIIKKKLTISMGLSESHKDLSPDILLQRADKRLYQAKQSGRNRVVWKEQS